MTNKNDKIRGCLVGGTIGDALGYAVEFIREPQIFSRYGKDGITKYELDNRTGKALISDDTQMTLFTAISTSSDFVDMNTKPLLCRHFWLNSVSV